uniref:Orf1594 n=1 Tax=Paramoeba pemaquidensis TaxID=180228 RepID=A0A1D8D5W8_9EUKA|nr:orf1594 [Paramoeba pemaquidensis]AOS85527.1 orf1594 [Paramoeba pemaquidensis]
MLHPIDYRLSKNKFWLSTWNSYSLKNYKNLILNDKILNVLGYIFKNCFKVSYSFASPWSNPRKHRKYFSNFIIGFDGRRAIKTGPNKVKKLPGFLIPEDYNIIRFHNFSILKIYFLIDKNLETYWAKKQKNWRSPLKYFNMRYNKNKNMINNPLRLNKNLVNLNIEKKNLKITGFFVYLFNLLNNNYVKQKLYFNLSDRINFFKTDTKHLYFRFYYDNFKLLNKVRNNYFLFYMINKKNSLVNNHKLGLLKQKSFNHNPNVLYFSGQNKKTNIKKLPLFNNSGFKINYSDYKKYISLYHINRSKKIKFFKNNLGGLVFYRRLLNNNSILNQINRINDSFFYSRKEIRKNIKKYFFYSKALVSNNLKIKNGFENFLNKKLKVVLLNSSKNNFPTFKKFNFDLNVSRKRGLTLFFNSLISMAPSSVTKKKLFLFKNKNKLNFIRKNLVKSSNQYCYKYNNNIKGALKPSINRNLHILNNRFENIISSFKNYNGNPNSNLIYQKQNYYNLKYFNNMVKNSKRSNLFINFNNFKKIIYFNKNFLNSFLKSNNYKTFFLKNYSSQNWVLLPKVLNLKIRCNNKIKKKQFYKIKRKKKLKINNYFNKLFINSTVFKTHFNKLLLKKNIYSYLINYRLEEIKDLFKSDKLSKKSNKRIKSNLFGRNRINMGNVLLSTTNFNKKKNYKYTLVDYDSLYFDSSKKFLNKKLNEYKTFLRIGKFNTLGFNNYPINNFNYDNFINYNYFSLLNNNYFFTSNTDNNLIDNTTSKAATFKNLVRLQKWSPSKTITPRFIFNMYFKKTFFKSFKNQDIYSKDNMDKINNRLEGLPKNNSSKLQKFKPYTFKSISKVHRYRSNKSILTKYITNEIKYNFILNFLSSMENKKTIPKKKLGYKSFKIWFKILSRAKGTVLLNNISPTKFNTLKLYNYSFTPFIRRFEKLMFSNKNIKVKETNISKEFSKKIKKYLSNHQILTIQKNSFINYVEKLQFKYFKRVKRSFKIGENKNIIIAPYKFLLEGLNRNNINISSEGLNKNFDNNFYTSLKRSSASKIKFNSVVSPNDYKYKMNVYNYFISNKKMKLKQFYLPINVNKKVKSIVPLVIKNRYVNNKIGYKKSHNMVINKYIKTRLSNIFLSSKTIQLMKNNKKTQVENFNYRVYGLAKKKSDFKFLNKKEFKKINELQPKTFLYWEHLKWFNTFVKTKFNFKVTNSYNSFKLYENFKNLNFYYYKNFKKYTNYSSLNSSQLLNNNYSKLNTFVFYSTIFRFRSSFLYLSNKKMFHKKKILSNWTYDVLFSSTSSKRLNYLPHTRFRSIRNSLYMWRINSRKLNLLFKYFKARTKFFKNKLNFVSNYAKRSSILSYLKSMESNFLRIKKSMQRELPLLSIKRYLTGQLKKLNNYIRILSKRQKKRLYFKSRQKRRFLNRNISKKLIHKISSNKPTVFKENKYIFKKLYTFVNKRFFLEKKNLIDYVKKFIEHLFLVIFKFNHLRVFYIKKYQINIMSTKAKLFKNLFNYRLATGFKVPFLVKVICKKLNFDKSLVGCKIGFFGRYSKKLRNRKLWKYVKQLKPSVISTPLDYYNILILQKWGITGIKLSILRKKTFNFIFN